MLRSLRRCPACRDLRLTPGPGEAAVLSRWSPAPRVGEVGEPDRRLARDLGLSRHTVARCRVWARRHGILAGEPLPDPAALAALLEPGRGDRPAHEPSLVEPFRKRVKALHDQGVEGQAIWQILVEEHPFAGPRRRNVFCAA